MTNPTQPNQLPIQKSDINVLESEFGGIHVDFENAMRRMQEDMDAFWQHTSLFNPNPGAIGPAAIAPTADAGDEQMQRDIHNAQLALQPIEPTTSSSLVQDLGDDRHLRLRFDLRHFAPQELQVSINDNCLRVHARHEVKTPNRSVMREYTQEFSLPYGVDATAMKTKLSKDGVLSVEAPLMGLVRR